MAQPGFYNLNRNISYPFLAGTVGVEVPAVGVPTMRQLPPDWIVDCGFEMGPESGFDPTQHTVWLQRIYRLAYMTFFEFACDAPALVDHPLTFSRDITEAGYITEFVDGATGVSVSASEDECAEPLWTGFLVTQASSRWADLDEIVAEDGDAIVEPGLIYNLDQGIAVSVELANADRTRATAPAGCPDVVWDYPVGVIFVTAACLRGEIYFKAGYNCVITQDDTENSITIGAAAGQGEGQPCAEVPLFEGETPPQDSSNELLSGGPTCNETLRSINGVGGPLFTLVAGQGVTITPDTENHSILIDVNMQDMAVCYSDFSQDSQSL